MFDLAAVALIVGKIYTSGKGSDAIDDSGTPSPSQQMNHNPFLRYHSEAGKTYRLIHGFDQKSTFRVQGTSGPRPSRMVEGNQVHYVQ